VVYVRFGGITKQEDFYFKKRKEKQLVCGSFPSLPFSTLSK
jgi:hypothetical protein